MRFDRYKELIASGQSAVELDNEIIDRCRQASSLELLKRVRDRLVILQGDEIIRTVEKAPDANWEVVQTKEKTLRLILAILDRYINLNEGEDRNARTERNAA